MSADLRQWAELAYFGSGVVVAIGVVYGLKQIRLVKKDIRLRNERAAKEKSIEYGSRYLNIYTQLDEKYFLDCRASKLPAYDGSVYDFTKATLIKYPKVAQLAMQRYQKWTWLPAMNELEAIAAAFTSGVADEMMGFKIIGRSFCSAVRSRYDLIALSRDENKGEVFAYWNNIVELYKMWSPRLTEADL